MLELASIKNACESALVAPDYACTHAQGLISAAGGAVRVVLKVAGIRTAFGKQLGSRNS